METETELRTKAQDSALHVFCRQAAEHLNNQAIERRVVLEELATRGIDLQWSEANFKEVWKGVQAKMLEIQSTKELKTKDPNTIYEALCVYFAQQHGATLPPFPSRHTQGLE